VLSRFAAAATRGGVAGASALVSVVSGDVPPLSPPTGNGVGTSLGEDDHDEAGSALRGAASTPTSSGFCKWWSAVLPLALIGILSDRGRLLGEARGSQCTAAPVNRGAGSACTALSRNLRSICFMSLLPKCPSDSSKSRISWRRDQCSWLPFTAPVTLEGKIVWPP